MYLMMRGEVYVATRAYVVSLAIVACTFVVWVQVLDLRELGLAISAVLGMTTFTLAQTAQMVWRKKAGPWPAVIGLGWTVIAVGGVLLLYGSDSP
jgi:hypothetical protein